MATDGAPVRPRGRGPALVLWDVDHTLVAIGGGVSRAFYERAFQQVAGRPLGALADMSGRTERAIMAETLRLNGIEEPEPLLADFYAALTVAADGMAGRMREVGILLPGAREAVAWCAAGGSVQSAVTGNLRPIAVAKLAALGLGDGIDFTVGGYGDDSGDRADLVRRARGLASRKYGHGFGGRRTVVVGDTPHDVRGALDAGALAVAVATGRHTCGELRASGADIVLDSLTDFPALCAGALAG